MGGLRLTTVGFLGDGNILTFGFRMIGIKLQLFLPLQEPSKMSNVNIYLLLAGGLLTLSFDWVFW